jgi:hypothetical protein
MKFIIDIAKEQGFIMKSGTYPNFSTAMPGGVRSFFEHSDGRSFVWGLNQQGKPPTLIWPRPKIIKRVERTIYKIGSSEKIEIIFNANESEDDLMNELLQKIPHDEIFKEIFSPSKVYDLNE